MYRRSMQMGCCMDVVDGAGMHVIAGMRMCGKNRWKIT